VTSDSVAVSASLWAINVEVGSSKLEVLDGDMASVLDLDGTPAISLESGNVPVVRDDAAAVSRAILINTFDLDVGFAVNLDNSWALGGLAGVAWSLAGILVEVLVAVCAWEDLDPGANARLGSIDGVLKWVADCAVPVSAL
jgi:hypothetical protein